MQYLAILAACLSVSFVSAAPSLLTRQSLANVYTACTVPNTVALTFDDGVVQYHQQISDLLTSNGVKGTFFVNGNNGNANACIYGESQVTTLRNSFAAGHQIASHTWSHLHLNTLSTGQITTEMSRVDEALTKILGVVPAMMRPPYGEYNDAIRSIAGARGQVIVNWDLDSGDSTGVAPAESLQRYTDAISKHPSTILALNHETSQSTLETVIPSAITQLKNAGYTFATVAECLGLPPYQSTGSSSARDSSWAC